MTPTPEMLASVPFQYAADVDSGRIVAGKRIKQAVKRFYKWVEAAGTEGNVFYLDHAAGMRIIKFFPTCLNHTVGKLQGQPFDLAAFQQFTMYNLFGWKRKDNGMRRISTVYDCRAKKNGKTAEMAGLSLYMMAMEMVNEAQVFVGATKEEQAKLCVKQAKSFISSAKANPIMRKLGFYTQRNAAGFTPYDSVMKALNKDPEKQDGIQVFLGIVDEYHAHPDDRIKENMQSATVLFNQPIMYHITTRGYNLTSPCKRYEDETIIPILEGEAEADHVFAMIHEMDEDDDWESEVSWRKANPLLFQGLDIDELRKFYADAQLQPSKAREFKTKNLNMWVDAPSIWIPAEIWKRNKHNLTPAEVLAKFKKFGGFAGADLSTKLDITAWVMLSNPDEEGNRYVVPRFFCPDDNIVDRSKADKVPYLDWRDKGLLIATPGNVVDYARVKAEIYALYPEYNIERADFDPWNASQLMTELLELGLNIAELPQNMSKLTEPTKEFEALVYSGKIKHDGNPILTYMLAGSFVIYDTKGNMMVSKGKGYDAGKRRIDGIPATINALAGSMSPPPATDVSIYDNPDVPFEC